MIPDDEDRPPEGLGDLPRRPRGIFRPQVLPTLLTLGNLFCGYLAIAKAADAMGVPRVPGGAAPEMLRLLEFSGWMIFLGMVFDALDGSVARLTGGASAMGNVLDSIADVVTFGAAPAFLAKCIAEGVGEMPDHRQTLFFSVFFALMAALRLARYSSHRGDPEEASLWFEGLPTPGAAGVIAGMAVLLQERDWGPVAAAVRWLPFGILALGLLMVSKLPYAHVSNRFLRGRKPVTYLVVSLAVLVLALAYHFEAALAAGMLAYALSGPAVGLLRRRGRRGTAVPAGKGGA